MFGGRDNGKQLDELIPFLGVTKRFRKDIGGLQDRCDVYEYEMPSTKLLSKLCQIETLCLVRMSKRWRPTCLKYSNGSLIIF